MLLLHNAIWICAEFEDKKNLYEKNVIYGKIFLKDFFKQ